LKNKTTKDIRELVGNGAKAEMFIVEHVDASFMEFLQRYYQEKNPSRRLNLQFLHDHVESGPWFDHNFRNIDAYIPKLHSMAADQHHANFRVIATRPFKAHSCLDLESQCLEPEPGTSRPGLYAVSMNAFHQGGKCEIPAVAMIRHHFTVWCDAEEGKPWTICGLSY
jgi:hypothetical protein